MDEKLCIHCLVSGRVQGVWFRAHTMQQAQQLGVTGWVRNLSDGRVEVMACGSREPLLQLQQWLHQGPINAQVTAVHCEELPWQEQQAFIIV